MSDNKTTADPMTGGLTPSPEPPTAPPEARASPVPHNRKDGASVADPEAQKPLTWRDPSWQPAIGASVQDLIDAKAVDAQYHMPEAVFAVWRRLRAGVYPSGLKERREALEHLTPTERGFLLRSVQK